MGTLLTSIAGQVRFCTHFRHTLSIESFDPIGSDVKEGDGTEVVSGVGSNPGASNYISYLVVTFIYSDLYTKISR
jgi:hypothetical protein